MKRFLIKIILEIKLLFAKRNAGVEYLYNNLKDCLYTSISEIKFPNWLSLIGGNLQAIKKKDVAIIEDVLTYAKYVLYVEYKDKFKLHNAEIARIVNECEITQLNHLFHKTNKSIYKYRAGLLIDRLKKEDEENKEQKIKIATIAERIFTETGQSYDIENMSAFEVLTILESINNRKQNGVRR